MLQQTKEKEFIGIIKSGLVGAFAFTGISLILSIVSGFTYRWMGWFLYIFYLTIPFPKTCFTVMGSIGFILGILLRRRFPIIQRGTLPLVIALVVLVGSLGWRSLLVNKMWLNTEQLPLSLKLADCTNSILNVHLKIPKGHNYYLELAIPDIRQEANGVSVSSYKFTGEILMSNKTSTVIQFPISSDKAFLGLTGFILTGGGAANKNGPVLSQFLQAEKDYDIQIVLNPLPPPTSSIWLHWW